MGGGITLQYNILQNTTHTLPLLLQSVRTTADPRWLLSFASYNIRCAGSSIAHSGIDRSQLCVMTKVWISDSGEQKVADAIEENWRMLRTTSSRPTVEQKSTQPDGCCDPAQVPEPHHL